MESRRKVLVGKVIGDKMDKTVTVSIESRRRHPSYRKIIKRSVKLKAHDGDNGCRTGDVVKIVESRPFSKTKHWRVLEVVSRGEVVEAYKDDSAVQQTENSG